MARRRIMVTYTMAPDVIERLEAWLDKQTPKMSKSAVVEAAIREFLDRRDKGKRK